MGRILLAAVGLLALAGAVAAVVVLLSQIIHGSGPTVFTQTTPGKIPAVQPEPVVQNQPSVSLIAVGDIMLSRSVGVRIAEHGPGYPFANIGTYLHSADFVFGNLETPVTVGLPVPNGSLSFWSDPSSVEGLKAAGVSMVSIANNHVPNAGRKGITDTVGYLDGAGIGHAGAGADEAAAEEPYYFQKSGIRFALLAYNDSDVVPRSYSAGANHAGTNFMDVKKVASNVAAAKLNADIVIVSMHAGHEYHDLPDVAQVAFAHAAIDAGADVVIGTHPHVVQPVEIYKGKYIFYSLGNFVFDQGFSYEVTRGMTVKLSFSKTGVESVAYSPVVIKKYSQPELGVDPADIQKIDARLYLDQAKAPQWKAEK